MASKQSQVISKSIFKSGENAPLKGQLTRKWVELINLIEKYKEITDGK